MSLNTPIAQHDNDNRATLIQELKAYATAHVDEHKDAFIQFLDAYLPVFPLRDWVGREQIDLYGCCLSLWQQLQGEPRPLAKVKVFNPSREEHQWRHDRTVILILQDDMPFLVDSIRLALNQREIPVLSLKSTPLVVERGAKGRVESIDRVFPAQKPKGIKEALIYVEVGLYTELEEREDIEHAIRDALNDVALTVKDYQQIIDKLHGVAGNIGGQPAGSETLALIEWLQSSHFTFLGYREYDLDQSQAECYLRENTACRLGLFKKLAPEPIDFSEQSFPPGVIQFHQSDDVVCFSKSSTRSTVHRDAYPDYIVFKRYDKQGQFIGEARFLGLFTYAVYTESPRTTPILRQRVDEIIARANVDLSSHEGKNLLRVIENFPRDGFFQSDIDTLYKNICIVAEINERHVVRLIIRRDAFRRFIICLIYVPRDLYNTRIKRKIQAILAEAFGSEECDSTSHFSESTLARAQFVFSVEQNADLEFNDAELEQKIVEVTQSWDENLQNLLVQEKGHKLGMKAYRLYRNAFSASYQEHFSASAASADIAMIDRIGGQAEIALELYQKAGAEAGAISFKIMHLDKPIELSDVIPVLEKLGLRVLGEHPYKITLEEGTLIWLHDFELKFGLNVNVDVAALKNQFEAAFEAVWNKYSESDAFNHLVLGARLSWREVALLRAYAAYMKQTRFAASRQFIAETLVNYPEITRNILALFKTRFDPKRNKSSKPDNEKVERLKEKILGQLDEVRNLNEDRVLRRYLEMLLGTLRTNYFQAIDDAPKPYLSIKFSPRDIDSIPEPRPMYEIFVYSPRMEGVHLRGGKVARGGLRWSDRLEDYRTEVLGLVKAQQVKNAVIVPTGAKGGFVAKNLQANATREEFMAEGIACYQYFIRGLLDITDNLVEDKIVPPLDVVRCDGDDPYLVVAADKGTATFSDIANEISFEYKHWLGDAFASGGSQGYDHKGMGITARGAWVSVQRHFREKGLDIQQEDFTVIGIGDMGGDVFGNGMLLSEHIRLVAAFNHLHIFIDPNPDARSSFAERQRLFATPGTNWADYQSELISKGGGIFSRAAKSITISPEMRLRFGIDELSMAPTDFISAILTAEVDLIWNGGIGTYAKASWESHADVGDKANDGLRVDGKALRCRVFGEGGNLGMTQLARIEYCLHGGACNTDFIDNAAGVDCSDHEVNIKILVDKLVMEGVLSSAQRNKLLVDMTENVAKLVLQNNSRQTLAISIAEFEAYARTNETRRFINYLESEGRLKRSLENIPSDEQIVERHGAGKGLTRPELSTLISYAKVMLKEAFTAANIAEDAYISEEVITAFPSALVENYPDQVHQHRLRREIVATQIANDFVNNMGISSAHRLIETTGSSLGEIAKAYVVSRDIFRFSDFHAYLASLEGKVSSSFQQNMMVNQVRRVRRGTRWFLRNRRGGLVPAKEVEIFQERLEKVHGIVDSYIEGQAREEMEQNLERYQQEGVVGLWAQRLAMPNNLFSGLGLVEASLLCEEFGVSVEIVVDAYFTVLDRYDLNWFATQLSALAVDNFWQAQARESYIDDLEAQVRRLTIATARLHSETKIEDTINKICEQCPQLVDRWKKVVREVQAAQQKDYAMFAVALRELIDLTQAVSFIEKV